MFVGYSAHADGNNATNTTTTKVIDDGTLSLTKTSSRSSSRHFPVLESFVQEFSFVNDDEVHSRVSMRQDVDDTKLDSTAELHIWHDDKLDTDRLSIAINSTDSALTFYGKSMQFIDNVMMRQ